MSRRVRSKRPTDGGGTGGPSTDAGAALRAPLVRWPDPREASFLFLLGLPLAESVFGILPNCLQHLLRQPCWGQTSDRESRAAKPRRLP